LYLLIFIEDDKLGVFKRFIFFIHKYDDKFR